LEDKTGRLRGYVQDLIGFPSAEIVLEVDLSISSKTDEIPPEVIHFDLPPDPMGFHHFSDQAKIALHEPLWRFPEKPGNPSSFLKIPACSCRSQGGEECAPRGPLFSRDSPIR